MYCWLLFEKSSLIPEQEKFQSKIQDIQKARAADNERASSQQQAAISAAVDKFKAEQQASGSTGTPDSIAKAHAEELRVLQERLEAEHQRQLTAALEAAKMELPASGGTSDVNQQAAIAAAIAAHDAELEPRRRIELSEATESGRKEVEMKLRLKDSQLLRAQNKLKEKEALILGWQNAGLVPKDDKVVAPAKTTTQSIPSSSTTPATTAALAANTAPDPRTAANVGTPAKPPAAKAENISTTARAPATTALSTSGARGGARARGASRGGLNIRGAAPGRGAPAATAAAASGGVSIIGAASKRTREEGEGTPDDSLAKRLKPAEGTSKPVAIRRPPPST